MTTFNSWLLNKILIYLSSKEGFTIDESEATATGIKSVVQDAFGHRYEVHVKIMSRITDSPGDYNEPIKFTQANSIGILEKKTKS